MHVHKVTGEAVQLLAQDQESVCHFRAAGATDDVEATTLPSHVFFADYREPTADELAKAAAPAAKPKEPVK